ncbi:MAG TPA: cation transporter [Ignavibacteria bacterium]|mgnify:CR=1 FL=1|nr:cation transporter [Ignavibacteria bacterium]
MTENENIKLKKKAAIISLLVGLGMFAAKTTAYLITGSNAIFSDAAESVVHVMATTMALYSIILSSRPPDKSHLYGHGNIEYFSAGIEGLLIVIAAVTIIYTSVQDIIIGAIPEKLGTGTMIIAAAGIINLFLGFYLIKKGKQTHSLALVADGKHVLTDSYTSIGVIVGLVLVMLTDFYLLDPIFAIGVALNILYTGYKLMRESIGGLMNETDKESLKTLVDKLVVMKKDYWIDVHHLRFWKSAEKIFVDFHLTLPYYFNIKKSHVVEEGIVEDLNKVFYEAQVRIHLDYCYPELCKYCDYLPCEVRKDEKTISIEWNTEKLIGDPIEEKTHDT